MMSRFALLIAMMISLISFAPSYSYAEYNSFNGVDCSGRNQQSAICNGKTSDNPISGDNGIITKIANIISYIAGAAAVIFILVGSLRYITAGGDASNAKKARDIILYSIIGLAVIVLARTLVIFVVNKLG